MFKICLLSLSSSLNIWKDILEPLGSAQTQKEAKDRAMKGVSLGN